MKYQALLVAPDGDYVTDFEGKTKDEVIEQLANRGSVWYFYPFEFVVTEKMGRIVDAPDELAFFKGKSVKKVLDIFEKAYESLKDLETEEVDIFDYIALLEAIANSKGRQRNLKAAK